MIKNIAILLFLTFSLASNFELVPADGDFANHGLMSAMETKAVYAFTQDEKKTFEIMTAIFIAKEIYDCIKPNPTGFSMQDLCADYLGYGLVRWELKF